MKRIYNLILEDHLKKYNQMFFIEGPRQVGKTTLATSLKKKNNEFYYFNWDIFSNRKLITKGQEEIATLTKLNTTKDTIPIIVFDEIHKYSKWKTFLKGFFDTYKDKCKIIVTGSSKLNTYRKGGDSMMGRYFLYTMYPITIGELARDKDFKKEISLPKNIASKKIESLWKHNGFPEPFLRNNKSFTARWRRLRSTQLFKEDIRDLSSIQEASQLEMLAEHIKLQVGQLLNKSELSNKINVSVSTISRWISALNMLYYTFEIKPWITNVRRTLIKTPKLYLYDWSMLSDLGARAENFVAVHLYKFTQLQNELGQGEYKLCYIRDKETREVDFIVIKNSKPWFLVEVKYSQNASLSKNLYYYQAETKAAHAFQVVLDMPYVNKNCFEYKKPVIVPASTFLSQLC